jgi:adenylate kinase family enzyme
MLGPLDPLPFRPRRVLIAGVSGTGKTTLAARVADVLEAPHTEIDALYHGPDWTPREEFLRDVDALVHTDRWTTEWQYSSARATLAENADLLVWLDLPFFTVTLPRVVRRTVRRRLRGEVLWNGNVEPPLRTFFTQREHIVRWAFVTRHAYRARIPRLRDDHPHLTVVRLTSARDIDTWMSGPLARSAR